MPQASGTHTPCSQVSWSGQTAPSSTTPLQSLSTASQYSSGLPSGFLLGGIQLVHAPQLPVGAQLRLPNAHWPTPAYGGGFAGSDP